MIFNTPKKKPGFKRLPVESPYSSASPESRRGKERKRVFESSNRNLADANLEETWIETDSCTLPDFAGSSLNGTTRSTAECNQFIDNEFDQNLEQNELDPVETSEISTNNVGKLNKYEPDLSKIDERGESELRALQEEKAALQQALEEAISGTEQMKSDFGDREDELVRMILELEQKVENAVENAESLKQKMDQQMHIHTTQDHQTKLAVPDEKVVNLESVPTTPIKKLKKEQEEERMMWIEKIDHLQSQFAKQLEAHARNSSYELKKIKKDCDEKLGNLQDLLARCNEDISDLRTKLQIQERPLEAVRENESSSEISQIEQISTMSILDDPSSRH